MHLLNKFTAAIALMLAVSGCNRTPEEMKAVTEYNAVQNAQSFSSPVKVGTLFSGQTVYLSTVAYSGPISGDNQTHYVYFVPGSSVETTNWRRPSGKTTLPMTTAMVELGPNPSPEQVIKVAEQLKKEQEQADLEQLQALCKKYGCKE